MRFIATEQALAAGEAVRWTAAAGNSCCDCTAVMTIAPKLNGGGNCKCNCCPTRYLVAVHVVVAATAAAGIQLALEVDGIRAPEYILAAPPATAGTPLSVDIVTEIPAECCGSRVALVAVTDVPLTAASMTIDRVRAI